MADGGFQEISEKECPSGFVSRMHNRFRGRLDSVPRHRRQRSAWTVALLSVMVAFGGTVISDGRAAAQTSAVSRPVYTDGFTNGFGFPSWMQQFQFDGDANNAHSGSQSLKLLNEAYTGLYVDVDTSESLASYDSLRFWARSSGTAPLIVQSNGSTGSAGISTISATSEWKQFTVPFTEIMSSPPAFNSANGRRLNILRGGDSAANVWIDDIDLVAAGTTTTTTSTTAPPPAVSFDGKVYSDAFLAGFGFPSWMQQFQFDSTTGAAHSGSQAIKLQNESFTGLYVDVPSAISIAPYNALRFWGRASGATPLLVQAGGSAGAAGTAFLSATSNWQQYTVPFTEIMSSTSVFNSGSGRRLNLLRGSDAAANLWIDDIELVVTDTTSPTTPSTTTPPTISFNGTIFNESLAAGFSFNPWRTAKTDIVTSVGYQSGSSIRVIPEQWRGANILIPNGVSLAPYGALSFWINGGSSGSTGMLVSADQSGKAATKIPNVAPNEWKKVVIPFSQLIGSATAYDLIQNRELQFLGDSSARPAIYLDDIEFTPFVPGSEPPALNPGEIMNKSSLAPGWHVGYDGEFDAVPGDNGLEWKPAGGTLQYTRMRVYGPASTYQSVEITFSPSMIGETITLTALDSNSQAVAGVNFDTHSSSFYSSAVVGPTGLATLGLPAVPTTQIQLSWMSEAALVVSKITYKNTAPTSASPNPCPARSGKIRIWTIGDSLTHGGYGDGAPSNGANAHRDSYRYELHRRLTTELSANVAFRGDYGSATAFSGINPPTGVSEFSFTGYGGRTITGFMGIDGVYNKIGIDPDVIVLNVGANGPSSNSGNELVALVAKLQRLAPHAVIVVGNPPTRASERTGIQETQYLPVRSTAVALGNALSNDRVIGSNVYQRMLDANNLTPADFADVVHFNISGGIKFANAFYPAVAEAVTLAQTNRCGTHQTFVDTPGFLNSDANPNTTTTTQPPTSSTTVPPTTTTTTTTTLTTTTTTTTTTTLPEPPPPLPVVSLNAPAGVIAGQSVSVSVANAYAGVSISIVPANVTPTERFGSQAASTSMQFTAPARTAANDTFVAVAYRNGAVVATSQNFVVAPTPAISVTSPDDFYAGYRVVANVTGPIQPGDQVRIDNVGQASVCAECVAQPANPTVTFTSAPVPGTYQMRLLRAGETVAVQTFTTQALPTPQLTLWLESRVDWGSPITPACNTWGGVIFCPYDPALIHYNPGLDQNVLKVVTVTGEPNRPGDFIEIGNAGQRVTPNQWFTGLNRGLAANEMRYIGITYRTPLNGNPVPIGNGIETRWHYPVGGLNCPVATPAELQELNVTDPNATIDGVKWCDGTLQYLDPITGQPTGGPKPRAITPTPPTTATPVIGSPNAHWLEHGNPTDLKNASDWGCLANNGTNLTYAKPGQGTCLYTIPVSFDDGTWELVVTDENADYGCLAWQGTSAVISNPCDLNHRFREVRKAGPGFLIQLAPVTRPDLCLTSALQFETCNPADIGQLWQDGVGSWVKDHIFGPFRRAFSDAAKAGGQWIVGNAYTGACGAGCRRNPTVPTAGEAIMALDKHLIYGANICVVACVGVTTQNGKTYFIVGVGVRFDVGVSAGWAALSPEKRQCVYDEVNTGTPVAFSAGRIVSDGGQIDWEDLEVDVGPSVGAGWAVYRAFGPGCSL
jgi:nitrate reductase NapE component/lysophospholipase L1-like esterase